MGEGVAHAGGHGAGVGPQLVVVEEGSQVALQLLAGGVAVVGLLAQAALEDAPEIVGDLRVLVPRIGDDGLADPAELFLGIGVLEQAMSHHQLVQHDARGVDVRALVELAPAHLLGGHVGELAAAGPVDLVAGALARQAGDAEVHHLHLAGEGDHDVVGAQVTVDDAQRAAVLVLQVVGVGQATQGGGHRVDRQRDRHHPALGLEGPPDPGQVAAVDVLHGDEPVAVGAVQLVDLDDVGVVEADRDAGLVDEHGHQPRAARQGRADALDHQPLLEALDPEGPRQEHVGHATLSDALQDLVSADLCGQLHRGGLLRGRSPRR